MKRVNLMFAIMLIAVMMALPVCAEDAKILKMATTTSTDSTGLLDYLKPIFLKDTGIELRWTATGTGKALKLGENCDVDVMLVHAPDVEKKYIADGFGVGRREIMYNDFILIGPESDPAKIKGKTIKDTFAAIKAQKAVFVSRGDQSGTHVMEKDLWKAAGQEVPEKEAWYIQVGQGMIPTIAVAEEKGGYTLTDRATYIKYEDTKKGNPPLKILVEGDEALKNQYSVIAVNPEKCKTAKYEFAKKYSDWMASPAVQQIIKNFKISDKQLFFPNAK